MVTHQADEPAFTQSARGRIRTAVEDLLSVDQAEYSLPTIVAKVIGMIDADPDWRLEVLAQAVGSHVRVVANEVIQYRRRANLPLAVLLGKHTMSRAEVDDFVERSASRFETWIERCNGRYINLLDMRRGELQAAAQERGIRVVGELHRMRLLYTLSKGLVDDEQTVGERYTSEELARMMATSALPATRDKQLVDLMAPIATMVDLHKGGNTGGRLR